MRATGVFFAVFFSVLPVVASEPGQPLDCSDWVFQVPGFRCSVFLPPPQPEQTFQSAWWARGNNIAADNEGNLVIVQERSGGGSGAGFVDRIELVRLSRNGEEVIGFVESRGDNLWRDRIWPKDACDVSSSTCWGGGPRIEEGFTFDPVNGRLFLPLRSFCYGPNCPSTTYGGGWWVAVIEGFAPLLEIFQSYQPTSGALTFIAPRIPEGFPAADYFDTYYGDIATMGDWSQAQPLRCNYPATLPHAGDYLTASDTLPNPSAGQGYYYVTAATYQGQTRYGRKRQGAIMSGRDPSLLPACVQPEIN